MVYEDDELVCHIQKVVDMLYAGHDDLSEVKSEIMATGYDESETESIVNMAKRRLTELLRCKRRQSIGNGIVLLLLGIPITLVCIAVFLLPDQLPRHAIRQALTGMITSLFMLYVGCKSIACSIASHKMIVKLQHNSMNNT